MEKARNHLSIASKFAEEQLFSKYLERLINEGLFAEIKESKGTQKYVPKNAIKGLINECLQDHLPKLMEALQYQESENNAEIKSMLSVCKTYHQIITNFEEMTSELIKTSSGKNAKLLEALYSLHLNDSAKNKLTCNEALDVEISNKTNSKLMKENNCSKLSIFENSSEAKEETEAQNISATEESILEMFH